MVLWLFLPPNGPGDHILPLSCTWLAKTFKMIPLDAYFPARSIYWSWLVTQGTVRTLVCSSIHATSHPNHVGTKSSSVRRCSLLCVRIVLNYEMISYLRRKSRLVRIRETADWPASSEDRGGEREHRLLSTCLQSHAVWSWNVTTSTE